MAEHGLHNISNISTNSPGSYLFTESYIVLLSLLAALIFFINLMVIFLFATRDYLRTKTNMILIGLSLSDLLNGILVIPLQIIVNIYITEQSLRLASMVFYRFIAVSTMLHILGVTLERHICILSPLRYHSLVTKSRIIKILVFIWLLSICNSVISLSWIGLADEYNHLKQPPGLHNSKLLRCEFTYTLFTFAFFFLIPLVIMAYSFRKIICEISRHNRRDSELMLESTSRNSNDSATGEDSKPRHTYILDRKPVLIFLAMLLVFSITWSSWYAQMMILSTSPKHYKPVGGIWPGFARSSTSVINPLLYALIKKDFRQALKSWLNYIRNLVTSSKTSTTEQDLTAKFPSKHESCW